jgi:hypothetical protein
MKRGIDQFNGDHFEKLNKTHSYGSLGYSPDSFSKLSGITVLFSPYFGN